MSRKNGYDISLRIRPYSAPEAATFCYIYVGLVSGTYMASASLMTQLSVASQSIHRLECATRLARIISRLISTRLKLLKLSGLLCLQCCSFIAHSALRERVAVSSNRQPLPRHQQNTCMLLSLPIAASAHARCIAQLLYDPPQT